MSTLQRKDSMGDIIDFNYIAKYITKTSSFGPDRISEKGLEFTTRENGDVYEEEYSEIDYQAAIDLIKDLKSTFPDLVLSSEIDTCDEWVNVYIELKH